MSTDTAPEERSEDAIPGVDIGAVSLEQALVDFEIANARVVDLTSRLTAMSADLMQVRRENEQYRLKVSQLSQDLDSATADIAEIRRSLAYRVARLLGDARARGRR